MLAYCSKCRVKRQLRESRVTTARNGRRVMQGVCPICGMKMMTMARLREATAIA